MWHAHLTESHAADDTKAVQHVVSLAFRERHVVVPCEWVQAAAQRPLHPRPELSLCHYLVEVFLVRGALELLVGKGGSIDHVDQIGGTPLLWAVALSENPATARYLVDAGASVNVVDKSGMTPLIWAAGIGQPEAVAILVDNGAEIDLVEIHSKESAMMRAARIGNAGSLRILLDADGDMELKNMMGQTAAVIAAAQGRFEKVKMLVDAGADLSVRDLRGWTVLDHARARTDGERTAVIEYLEAAVPDEVRNAKPVVGG